MCNLFVGTSHYEEPYSLSHGLIGETILFLEYQDRPTIIWEGNEAGVLMIQYHSHMQGWMLHDCVRPYFTFVGLYGVSNLDTIAIDHAPMTTVSKGHIPSTPS